MSLELIGYRKVAMSSHHVTTSSHHVTNVTCQKIHKKTKSNNTQVFDLSVVWSDGKSGEIQRPYTAIFDFMQTLKQRNPGSAIPEIKAAKWFDSGILKGKKKAVDEFFQKILSLPDNIVQGKDVCDFFEFCWPENTLRESNGTRPRSDFVTHKGMTVGGSSSQPEPDYESVDLDSRHICHSVGSNDAYHTLSIKPKSVSVFGGGNSAQKGEEAGEEDNSIYWAVLGYSKRKSGEVDLSEGAAVSVLQRELSGWWFVHVEDTNEQGWAPASCLLPVDRKNLDDGKVLGSSLGLFQVISDFKGQLEDELTCKKGETVEVVEASLDGWWQARYKNKVGRIPGTFLEPVQNKIRSSLYHQVGIYKKYSPPPRRNSRITVDELYAQVDKFRKKKVHTKPVTKTDEEDNPDYAEVDLNRNLTLTDYSEENIYMNEEGLDATGSHRPYINISMKPTKDQVKEVKYYRADARYAPVVKHMGEPLLAVEPGDIIESQIGEPERVFARIYVLANGSFAPESREGWISRKFLVQLEPAEVPQRPAAKVVVGGAVPAASPVKCSDVGKNRESKPKLPKRKDGEAVPTASTSNSSQTQSNSSRPEPMKQTSPVSSPTRDDLPVSAYLLLKKVPLDEEAFTVRKLDRTECENLLLKSGTGQQFIIRESTKPGHFALSVRSTDRIHHFPIELTQEKKYFIGKYNFDSLVDVVSYYKKNPLFQTEDGTGIMLGTSLESDF